MNVFDLRGPAFLQFYIPLLLLSLVGGLILRWLLRGPGGDTPNADLPTDPYDVATLGGGRRAAVLAAGVALVQRQLVGFADGKFTRGEITSQPNAALHPVERAVADVITKRSPTTLSQLVELASSAVSDRALYAHALIVEPGRRWMIRIFPAILPILATILGAAKISIGLSRNRPVAILVLLTLIGGVTSLGLLLLPAYRTRRGERALTWLRGMKASLRTTAKSNAESLDPADVALACALFGPLVFATAGDDTLRSLSRHVRQSSDSTGWSNFGDTSSGGGSSGCGSSGCGGGGCGGCGGCGS